MSHDAGRAGPRQSLGRPHAVADDEETTDALLRAADSAHVDINDVDFPLYDQTDTSALDGRI